MINWIKKELEDYKVLLRNIPALTVTLFMISVVAMNLFASKELINCGWIALNCGIAFSWVSFLSMDCICKRYGSKASIKISVLAIAINFALTIIMKLLSMTPGVWSAYYSTGNPIVNDALNSTIGSTWYVVVGSAIATFVSSVVNSVLNVSLGKKTKGNGYGAFAFRSFISTGIAQFVDNFVFSLLVSKVFFGWTWEQVFFCSLTVAFFELLMEVFFSGFGYKTAKEWEKDNVGEAYLKYAEQNKA